MNSNEYQDRAVVLASEPNGAVQDRLVQHYGALNSYLVILSAVGEKLDEIKKYGFYNRQNGLQNASSPIASEEQEQRLRDCAGILHAILGIATESAELADAFLKHIKDGEPLDKVNLLEEFGDLDWYKVYGLSVLGYTNEQCQDRNIEKLESRYKQKQFSEAAANNRDLETERKILEDVQPQDVNS